MPSHPLRSAYGRCFVWHRRCSVLAVISLFQLYTCFMRARRTLRRQLWRSESSRFRTLLTDTFPLSFLPPQRIMKIRTIRRPMQHQTASIQHTYDLPSCVKLRGEAVGYRGLRRHEAHATAADSLWTRSVQNRPYRTPTACFFPSTSRTPYTSISLNTSLLPESFLCALPHLRQAPATAISPQVHLKEGSPQSP